MLLKVLSNLDLDFEENVLGYNYAAAKELAGLVVTPFDKEPAIAATVAESDDLRARCLKCKSGNPNDGGVLVPSNGMCTAYCTVNLYCGAGADYSQQTGVVDCSRLTHDSNFKSSAAADTGHTAVTVNTANPNTIGSMGVNELLKVTRNAISALASVQDALTGKAN